MPNGCISLDRILAKLDAYLHQKDFSAAERHLNYWLAEAQHNNDRSTEMAMRNELMGLYRKLGREREALGSAQDARARVEELGISHQVGAATTYLNCATVCKAFGRAEEAIPLFEAAREIYERELEPADTRLGGLYNNMALALVDLGRYLEANDLYHRAIWVMKQDEKGSPELAVTYLNLASAAEAERGLEDAAEIIESYLKMAKDCLEAHPTRDGYYAFVCEKCASVFGYYGHFYYAKELADRARRIYEGT